MCDLDDHVVLFWDGCERTQAELDAVLPGLFDYVRSHPKLAEITPYNLTRELAYWGGMFLLLICTGVTLIVWMGAARPSMLIAACFVSSLAAGTRIIVGFVQSQHRPAIIAHDGLFEVYKRGRYQQGPIWSTTLTDIDWRFGKGHEAASREECILEGSRRKVVLVRRRRKSFFQKDEFYACGWTPEMMKRWLALFEISSLAYSDQAAESGIPATSP